MKIKYSSDLDGTTRDFDVVIDKNGVTHAGIAVPDELQSKPEMVQPAGSKTKRLDPAPLQLMEYHDAAGSKLPSQMGDLIDAYLLLEELYQDFSDELGERTDWSETSYDDNSNPAYPDLPRVSEKMAQRQWQEFGKLKLIAPYKPLEDRLEKKSTWRRQEPKEVSKDEIARDELRNQIAMQHVGVLFAVANREFDFVKGTDRKDMIQEAATALLLAVEKYDPGKGFKLSSYAWKYVKGFMLHYLAHRDLINVPENLNEAEKVDVDLLGDSSELCEQEEPVLTKVVQEAARESLLKIMGKILTPNEEYILLRRLGLDGQLEVDGDGDTLERISRDRNISRELVRQIERSAMRKLRSYMRENHIAATDILSA